jgi:hypothetical protein
MTIEKCPECKTDTDPRGMVRVEVTLSAGDDNAGSSTTACVCVCGSCGQALLGKYTGIAVEEHRRTLLAATDTP